MVRDHKVPLRYAVKEGERQFSNGDIHLNHCQRMPRNSWKATVVPSHNNRMATRSYEMKNKDTVDGLRPPQECDAASPLRKRWKEGNILIVMLPIGASLLPSLFIFGAYIHANTSDSMRLNNRTNVPYVSDIGNHKPHSSVFTLGLSLGAMFGFWLILVRHIQVDILYDNRRSKANMASSFAGLIGILGELVVGSFQLSSHSILHYLGAFVHFVSIMVFMFLQTFITHRNIENVGTRKNAVALIIVRGLLSSGLLMSIVVFGVFVLLPSLSEYNRTGYSIAQIAEWVMFGSVVLFMLTFLYDFRNLTCSVHVEYLTMKDSRNVYGFYNQGVDPK